MRSKRTSNNGQWSVTVSHWPLVVLCLMLFAGCRHGGEEVRFHRFEQLLFDTPADRLPAEMLAHEAEYSTELITIHPRNQEYVEWVQGYVADPVMRDIYHVTDSLYHNLSAEERQLGRALRRAYRLCPDMPHVQRFYTLVTGDYDNYDNRVYTNGRDLCLMLDVYSLDALERYQCFGLPNHVVRLCTREQIVPDCIRRLAVNRIAWPDRGQTLLDYAVAEGKTLYFVEQCLPGLADTTLFRYTGSQLRWMKQNEKNVWSWLIQNKALYSTDISLYQNLLGDAPHTNAFGSDSAPRTAAYIGWQIVRTYMKKNRCTMQQLLDETDSQKILTASGWRP